MFARMITALIGTPYWCETETQQGRRWVVTHLRVIRRRRTTARKLACKLAESMPTTQRVRIWDATTGVVGGGPDGAARGLL